MEGLGGDQGGGIPTCTTGQTPQNTHNEVNAAKGQQPMLQLPRQWNSAGFPLQSSPKPWLNKPTLHGQPQPMPHTHHLPQPLNPPFATSSLHGTEEVTMTSRLTASLGEQDPTMPWLCPTGTGHYEAVAASLPAPVNDSPQ